MNRLLPVIFTFVVFLLIIAPGNSEAFWPHYPDESLLISPSSWKPGMSPDGEGGAFILITLQTGGSTAGIFIQRLLGSGGFAWDLWDGLIVSDYQVSGVLADDGQGGCLVGYYPQDYSSGTHSLSVNRLGPDGVSHQFRAGPELREVARVDQGPDPQASGRDPDRPAPPGGRFMLSYGVSENHFFSIHSRPDMANLIKRS